MRAGCARTCTSARRRPSWPALPGAGSRAGYVKYGLTRRRRSCARAPARRPGSRGAWSPRSCGAGSARACRWRGTAGGRCRRCRAPTAYYAAVAAALRDGTPPPVTAAEAADALDVLERSPPLGPRGRRGGPGVAPVRQPPRPVPAGPAAPRGLRVLELLPLAAEAVDLQLDDVAGPQVRLRLRPPIATPAGVPVLMTSPGYSVMNRLTYRTTSPTGKIWSAVLPSCWSLAVHPQPHPQVLRVRHLVGGDQPRAEG